MEMRVHLDMGFGEAAEGWQGPEHDVAVCWVQEIVQEAEVHNLQVMRNFILARRWEEDERWGMARQHTIHGSTGWIWGVGTGRLRRSLLSARRSSLWKMLRGLLVLGRWGSETRTTAALVGHNTTKQIAGTMTKRRRRLRRTTVRLGATDMRRDRLHATRFKLMAQMADFGFVAKPNANYRISISKSSFVRRTSSKSQNILLLHFHLSLLQLEDLRSNHLHLLKLAGHYYKADVRYDYSTERA
jgi:hypothetical protein